MKPFSFSCKTIFSSPIAAGRDEKTPENLSPVRLHPGPVRQRAFYKSSMESKLHMQLLESMDSGFERNSLSRPTTPSSSIHPLMHGGGRDDTKSTTSRYGVVDKSTRGGGPRRRTSLTSTMASDITDALTDGVDMRVEENRRQSFLTGSWTNFHVLPENLAAAGFFFTSYQDRLVLCSGGLLLDGVLSLLACWPLSLTIFLHIPPYSSIFLRIPPYSSVFLHIPLYSSVFLHIPLYSSVSSIFLHIQGDSLPQSRLWSPIVAKPHVVFVYSKSTYEPNLVQNMGVKRAWGSSFQLRNLLVLE